MLHSIEQMAIKPIIDRSFAFEDLKEGLSYLKSGRQFGKIVIEH